MQPRPGGRPERNATLQTTGRGRRSRERAAPRAPTGRTDRPRPPSPARSRREGRTASGPCAERAGCPIRRWHRQRGRSWRTPSFLLDQFLEVLVLPFLPPRLELILSGIHPRDALDADGGVLLLLLELLPLLEPPLSCSAGPLPLLLHLFLLLQGVLRHEPRHDAVRGLPLLLGGRASRRTRKPKRLPQLDGELLQEVVEVGRGDVADDGIRIVDFVKFVHGGSLDYRLILNQAVPDGGDRVDRMRG
mmetsp:Transcript_83090/g.251893  ORF Transcript_83090/g.251893 Transcript_83090/m.251893 type:complete len:247 (+) Transcript_83090:108-848(+)